MVKLVLITHGNLGEALLNTATAICCCTRQDITTFSVTGKVNLNEIESKIKKSFTREETLIMVDSFGGTSSNIALKCFAENNNISIACGVNLNMVLSALNNHNKMSLAELAAKVISDGKKAILDATELVKK